MDWNSSAVVLVVSVLALLIRCTISLHGYSGAGKPPMYGDFEAQRHWMEITYNLPASDWYKNTTNNDLMYWGLDYPPLTAYHSLLCGYVASLINQSWVELFTSRGLESNEHKLFMRATVIIADILIFFPAIFLYFKKCCKSLSPALKIIYAALTLLYPGLMLVDHGHFQYNSVSLGFLVWGVVGILMNHDLLGAAAFVLALNYKQMELYHAVPFFCYLFGSCFKGREFWLSKLVKIALVTILTFIVCWLPFVGDFDNIAQVLHRLFPFARGLYEDKVANIWCSLSIFIKFKDVMKQDDLIKLCLGSTLFMLLPSAFHLLVKPTKHNFKLALVNSALVFFLFSFQVHEKSILIPAVSVCLLFPDYPFACMWFLLLSVFSMVPLLIKDGLLVPTIASTLIFFIATISLSEFDKPSQRPPMAPKSSFKPQPISFAFWPEDILMMSMFVMSMVGTVLLTFMHLKVKPPPDLPDIYPVLIAAYSCAHFCVFYLFFLWQQCIRNTSQLQTYKVSDANIKHTTANIKQTTANRAKKRN